MESAREFFAALQERIDPERARGLDASYPFDIEGAGSWRLASASTRESMTNPAQPPCRVTIASPIAAP